jgi:hypothetical protein
LSGFLNEVDLLRQREKRFKRLVPEVDDLVVSSPVTSLSNRAICPFTSPTEAATVCSGINCVSVRSPELRSNATTLRFSPRWKSVSSRAINVFPTRGRGDATMVMELRNDIT